jgi:ATP-dependent Lon protease
VRDLELLPEHVRDELAIIPVSTMDEVLDRALLPGCVTKPARKKSR